jgi:protein-disulfide isomerase
MLGCALLASASLACAQQPEAGVVAVTSVNDPVVARIGDDTITESELEEMVAPSLVALRQQIYDAKIGKLKSEIFERLVAEAAAAEGIPVEEYLQKNLEGKVVDPDETEIVKFMTMYRTRLSKDDLEARNQAIQVLTQQQQQRVVAEMLDAMFAEAGVVILLEPPRVEVALGEGTPSRGPLDAPVVLVEYTDFQCPYCSRVQPTIDALVSRYGDHVLFVTKNLPLPMHPQAQLAGEASLCAQDQAKFWEFRGWLFANQRTMNRETMIAAAGSLGLDQEVFGTCIESGAHAAQVQADMVEARSFGITGTPGFLINGRVISGAQPVESFEVIINEELTRKGVEVPPKQAAAMPAAGEETVAQ